MEGSGKVVVGGEVVSQYGDKMEVCKTQSLGVVGFGDGDFP